MGDLLVTLRRRDFPYCGSRTHLLHQRLDAPRRFADLRLRANWLGSGYRRNLTEQAADTPGCLDGSVNEGPGLEH